MPGPIHRVHVGAGDPLGYAPGARAFFGDGSWVHLHAPGETADSGGRPSLRRLASSAKQQFSRSARERRAHAERERDDARLRWRFLPFWLDEKSFLPLRSGGFTFALSEHVLEHLFLHEAYRVMQEVRRVLAPGGVFRVSVPDADLRPGLPEPVAFHAGRLRTSTDAARWNDPAVHKTRFNVYSLTLLLELAGFTVVPLRAYDRRGALLGRFPLKAGPPYAGDADWDALLRSDYLRRPDSLILDALAGPVQVRPPAQA
ncbi:MAG TPA: methyltransferase domain-containing protein [Patescibacteria group bacterium]|nr:methyltransferase domain-containing protein [Patescibacteria group bacterium]